MLIFKKRTTEPSLSSEDINLIRYFHLRYPKRIDIVFDRINDIQKGIDCLKHMPVSKTADAFMKEWASVNAKVRKCRVCGAKMDDVREYASILHRTNRNFYHFS